MTLVEIIIAVGLSVFLVAVIALTVTQAQTAMDGANYRQATTSQVRSLFADIERDLHNMIPCSQGLAPLAQDARSGGNPQLPLSLESPSTTGLMTLDVLRVYTGIDVNGTQTRGVVEYSFDGYPAGPNLVNQPGGGPQVARLRRHILAYTNPYTVPPYAAGPGTAVTETGPNPPAPPAGQPALPNTQDPGTGQPLPPPVLLDNCLSITIQFLPRNTSVSQTLNANAPYAGPIPANGGELETYQLGWQRPDNSTQYGARFVLTGTFDIGPAAAQTADPATGPFGMRATDVPGKQLLSALPVGSTLLLPVGPPIPPAVKPFLVPMNIRGITLTEAGVDPATNIPITLVDNVLLNQRIDTLLPAQQVSAFLPPQLIQITIVVPFGRGPDAQQARFSRVFAVPHSS
jgi:hypothetical protein